MSEKIDKIIFDFDGTVANTFQLNVGLIKEMRPDTSKKEIELFRNNGVAVLQKELNLSLKEVLKLLGLLAKKQMQIINKAKIFPGIKNIFDELRKRDIKIIILSSNTTENIEKWLVHQKIKVDKIITNNNIFGKDKLLRKMGRQFVYVGDEVRDVEACKKAGVKMIGVTWGFNTKEALKKAGADYLVDNRTELRKLLLTLIQ
ncbi:MAG TPA: HAD hydrolase-like protein [Candidatus Woesebacteria bacterium]|nr:HAD hydrolase-like protein [Candidatus Woesebacteria bacterium]